MENTKEIMNDVGSSARKVAGDLKSDIKGAASDVKSAARTAQSNLRDELTDRYDQFRSQAKDAVEYSEGFVKEHPLSTVLGAAAVGFIAGALLSRITRD